MSTVALQTGKRSLVNIRSLVLHIDCAYASTDVPVRSSTKPTTSV
ncbi:unnamed protein product, partial [Rotaria magnacalcarata]